MHCLRDKSTVLNWIIAGSNFFLDFSHHHLDLGHWIGSSVSQILIRLISDYQKGGNCDNSQPDKIIIEEVRPRRTEEPPTKRCKTKQNEASQNLTRNRTHCRQYSQPASRHRHASPIDNAEQNQSKPHYGASHPHHLQQIQGLAFIYLCSTCSLGHSYHILLTKPIKVIKTMFLLYHICVSPRTSQCQESMVVLYFNQLWCCTLQILV